MRELPKNHLDPRIKKVWRISAAIWIALTFACCMTPFVVASFAVPDSSWLKVALLLPLVLFGICLVAFMAVIPSFRYARWRYDLSDDFLEISKGIIWRNRYLIPFIRVQNTDTRQGPIMRAFGLASVTVSTAAGEHEIPGLSADEADLLRDRTAELARIAREDV